MTIKLSTKGGGGGFITKFASKTIEVNSGATGTYVTLTPPTGQKVKLTSISSSGVAQTNLTTISVGGSAVVTDAILNQVNIGCDVDELSINNGAGNQDVITGDVDEVLEISTNVSTSQGTFYSYQFGE